MGLFGREGNLRVALSDRGNSKKDIRLNLGFFRPLCIGKADSPNAKVVRRAFSLALSHPRQLAFSTDMPNHGGLGSYPSLFEALMKKEGHRLDESTEGSGRGYALQDLARVTRQIPAEILNLTQKGHLGVGAVGDIAVYDLRNGSKTLSACLNSCAYLMKGGKIVVEGFKMVADEVEKRSFYSGRDDGDRSLAREVCRSMSLRFENVRVDQAMTGKTVYVAP